AAGLDRRSGDAAGAHRARRRISILEGPGGAVDPAGAARSRGGPRARELPAPRGDLSRPPVSFALVTQSDPTADPTPPRPPGSTGAVQDKGAGLHADPRPGRRWLRVQ